MVPVLLSGSEREPGSAASSIRTSCSDIGGMLRVTSPRMILSWAR